MQEVQLPDFSPPSPALSARSDTSGQSAFDRLRNFSLGRASGKQFELPPPALQNGNGRGPIRQMTSLEQLGSRLTRSAEAFAPSSTSTLVESEDDINVDFAARKRLSSESMPGSLGARPSESDEEMEVDEEMDENADEEYGEEGVADPAEAAEEGFDEDFLATGEMENVPFL